MPNNLIPTVYAIFYYVFFNYDIFINNNLCNFNSRSFYYTALHLAAKNGNAEIVRMLIDYELTNVNEKTILHYYFLITFQNPYLYNLHSMFFMEFKNLQLFMQFLDSTNLMKLKHDCIYGISNQSFSLRFKMTLIYYVSFIWL